MTRGRPVTRGVSDAVRIAKGRGTVMQFCAGTECVSDFMIRTPAHLVFVRVKRFIKILSPVAAIEAEHEEIIGEIRSLPSSDAILYELWVYSKHGTYRFFRIMENGIREIGRDGSVPAGAGREMPLPALPVVS